MNVTASIAVIVVLGTMVGSLSGCGPRQAIERSGARTDRAVSIGADVASSLPDAQAGAPAEGGAEGNAEVSEDRQPDDVTSVDANDLPAVASEDAAVADALSPVEGPSRAAPSSATTNAASSVAPGMLRVGWSEAPADTDLSRLGQLDWVHWGHRQASALNRKRGVPPRIQATTLGQRSVGRYDDRPPRVGWNDGTPTEATRTPEGIATGSEVGAGFLVRVSGPLPGVSRLTVQLGVWNARGQLEVSIDGQPALGRHDRRLEAEHPGTDRAAVIDFGPLGAGQALLVRWTVAALEDQFGNVTLQAAALSSALAF